MLCCSDKPLVPFIGADISKWCYPLWRELLIGIVREVYSDKCAEFVEEARECTKNPKVRHEEEFLWTKEIAECIFCEDKESYRKIVEKFSLIEKEDNRSLAVRILQNLRDYVGEEFPSKKRDAEKVLYKRFDYALLKESGKEEYVNASWPMC